MKKVVLAALTASMLVLNAQATDLNFGLGIGVTGVSNPVVKAPIDIDGQFRIEPEVAIQSIDNGNGSNSTFSIGAGAYLLNKTSETTSLYYGGKLLLGDEGLSSQYSTELAGVFGFEYYMDPKVSIGGEASFGLGFGDVSGYATHTSVNLRYYF